RQPGALVRLRSRRHREPVRALRDRRRCETLGERAADRTGPLLPQAPRPALGPRHLSIRRERRARSRQLLGRHRLPSAMRSCAGLSGAVLALLLVTGCRAVGAKEEELPFALDLEFHGEVTVDEPRLEEIVRRELVRLEVSAPDKAAVDDAAFAIERFSRARGYADVEVDYEFDPVPGGT